MRILDSDGSNSSARNSNIPKFLKCKTNFEYYDEFEVCQRRAQNGAIKYVEAELWNENSRMKRVDLKLWNQNGRPELV